ncbi:uncharacterized protein LOC109285450 [Alligator mississippiensis]|uniref:uncharacterized protein LOC109285450 n=1 Tax=Alligator mississippiensis TaxID=8496 RepID=UPI002877A967|nr:uncharacterized protein LOC109285450 [Alligator mississippiensis]
MVKSSEMRKHGHSRGYTGDSGRLGQACKYSIKWLPKSPKLYGSRNWSSQSSRWASLRGKESVHGGNLYKFNSDNEKWKEGRVSPEQEAEELEDPDEDEPISKFSGSLFDSDDTVRDQRLTRIVLQEKHKATTKFKTIPGTNDIPQISATATENFLTGNNAFPEETKEQVPRVADVTPPPLKEAIISETNTPDIGSDEVSTKINPFQTVNHVITIPRIILTRPSTSDEDNDQLIQDPEDFEPEETDSAESHMYSDCMNNAFYPP